MTHREELARSSFAALLIVGGLFFFGLYLPTQIGLGNLAGWDLDTTIQFLFIGGPLLILLLIAVGIVSWCDKISRGDEFQDAHHY